MAIQKTDEVFTLGPPWHAWLFVATTSAYIFSAFPSFESIDAAATIDVFTQRLFPNVVSIATLGLIRLCVAISCWYTTYAMISSQQGWTVHTNYRPSSKLQNMAIEMKGLRTLAPFTSWCFIMLSLSFSLNAAICLDVHFGLEHHISPQMLRSALILWELSAPFALLVSAVVRYAIWPVVLAGGKPHSLASPRNIMMHNLNAIFVLSERCLLGGLPVYQDHRALVLLCGIIYILFSWGRIYSYGPKQKGPQFIYWFMDYSLGNATTIALLALLMTFLVFYSLFSAMGLIIDFFGGGVLVQGFLVVGISSLVCRFRE